MSGIADGITVGDQGGLDPNNQDDFAKILEGRGVAKVEGDDSSTDTSIASGLTVAGPEQQARDADTGKFTPSSPPATQTDATDTSGAGVEDDDPVLAAFLAKHNGDAAAALKAAAHQTSLVGTQGQELGELRQNQARLQGQLEALMTQRQAPAAPALTDDQVVEGVTSRIEQVGYAAAATEAANIAHTSGDERGYRAILEQWNIEDPFSALDYHTDFRNWQAQQRAAAQQQEVPAWQLVAEDQAKVAQYGASLGGLKAELGDEAFTQVVTHLDAALEQMPQNVLGMIDSTDAEARAAGFRIVADRALRLSAAAPPAPAAAGDAAAQAAEAARLASVERKLKGAAVSSGALQPAGAKPGEAAPASKEDAIKAFKQAIVNADSTSVASGLTYGPTQ